MNQSVLTALDVRSARRAASGDYISTLTSANRKRPCILVSVPHPHQHAAERPVLDQVANRLRRIGERKYFRDGRADRTFGQIADECLLRGGQRLRRKGPKSEATYLGRLPDDVGEVDACLATASVADHCIRPSGKQATKRLACELSAHAIDHDVHTPAAGEPHHAVSQALAREVDDVLVAASMRLLGFRPSAGGRNRERCAELAGNLHTLHTHRTTYTGSKHALPGFEGNKLRQHEIPGQIARTGEKGAALSSSICEGIGITPAAG